MKTWRKIRLGDACKTNMYSYSPKEKWNFVNYLDTGNITDNKIDLIQYIDIVNEKLPSRARRKVKKDSIIYSTVRPNQHHFGIIKSQPENFLVSTGFAVIDTDSQVLDADFLYYLLTQSTIVESLHAIAEQSTSAYPSIKPSDIENLEIEIPDIATQKKIADVLFSLDKKMAQNRKINKNLLQQAQALYKDRFVELRPFNGEMPPDWHLGEVSEIIELHDSKRIPLSSRERATLAKLYPYYGATSVMDYVDRYLFDGIYLLLGEDGTVVDNNGFPILQYVEGKFWVNNHAHIITGKNGFTVEMLYLLFSLTNVQSIITGAVQPKISQTNLNKMPIVIPSKAELSDFNSVIQPIFAQIRNLRAQNNRLVVTRDTLLPRLMSGELDVSNLDL
ncbi:restriction endonuclease subunit S [Lactobacillus iners]|uniref:restriction endonuclease subunit S n=1 Tax=Lactobacillus iners TaxID=147802 RepID=UPI001F09BEE5|nr:restriction endonuclease subunit S [Lactobacillus iners]